jgi:hypothetical protein
MSLDLNAICERHEMSPKYRPEFFALVMHGRRPSREMRTRLKHVTNYKAALDEAMVALSAPYAHIFEVPAPSSITRFESLVPEGIA